MRPENDYTKVTTPIRNAHQNKGFAQLGKGELLHRLTRDNGENGTAENAGLLHKVTPVELSNPNAALTSSLQSR